MNYKLSIMDTDQENNQTVKVLITGYHGCSCHPYSSWAECNKLHGQKMQIGEKVQQRHTGELGVVHELYENKIWCIVKYGDLPRDHHLENVASLIKINN
jgi:hypothetical protein